MEKGTRCPGWRRYSLETPVVHVKFTGFVYSFRVLV
jgi:hypothetical protein